jgi:predicted amidohydrolase
MSARADMSSTFTVGLVQMRSGLDPAANLDAAIKLIGEAKAGGADYVLTPEMTNIMEIRRERLFAAIVTEEADRSLAAFRELARKLAIHLHVGWQSSFPASAPPTAPS